MTSPSKTFLVEVLEGLRSSPKTLPCKYLYDTRGSELFEEICALDEYYATRADLDATQRNIDAIVANVGAGCLLVELGSGSSTKTRVLLDHLPELAGYVPIDISRSALELSTASLRVDYPELEVLPLCADYTQSLELPKPQRTPQKTLIYYPGSTIGNFHPPAATAFLRRIAVACGGDGAALIGVDLKKDKARLERAYDDAKGVTAAFNLNLLSRINRELGANFELAAFAHEARYNEKLGRVEMHLVSQCSQTVAIAEHEVIFSANETIRTEESYKYNNEDFSRLAQDAGMRVEAAWTDAQRLFGLQYLVQAG